MRTLVVVVTHRLQSRVGGARSARRHAGLADRLEPGPMGRVAGTTGVYSKQYRKRALEGRDRDEMYRTVLGG